MTVERVVFLDGSDAEEAMDILDKNGVTAAFEYLLEWYYPGEHDSSDSLSHGTSDDVYEWNDCHMAVNRGLGYVGLDVVVTE